VAKFSHDSILKQEEALAELDASIDDWVSKLEHAENRRTRVRQKLLEHVAAACTLPTAAAAAASETLQLAMGIRPSMGVGNISTPPRSPTKVVFAHTSSGSPSPSRAVAAQVPSTILEQPLFEEAAMLNMGDAFAEAMRHRCDVESIRIYADSDVYALLADVENQITKMSSAVAVAAAVLPEPEPVQSPMSDDERRELHRARSHELLSGLTSKVTSPATATAPVDSPAAEGEMLFLTSAVFKP
jgi:hypothetical protein